MTGGGSVEDKAASPRRSLLTGEGGMSSSHGGCRGRGIPGRGWCEQNQEDWKLRGCSRENSAWLLTSQRRVAVDEKQGWQASHCVPTWRGRERSVVSFPKRGLTLFNRAPLL